MMNTICDLYLMPVVLNLFDGNTNTTLDAGLSDDEDVLLYASYQSGRAGADP